MPSLRIHHPETGVVTHELSGARITVGRRPDNTIQIIDRSVSAHHAEFLFVEGHYRLHDLESTNSTFVDGAAISDYHLLGNAKLAFGTVQCEFDTATTLETRLSPAQMEKDVAFLRADNMELQAKIEGLERRISILNSARLVTSRTEMSPAAAANDALRALKAERDDLMRQNTGLTVERDKLREQLALMEAERAVLDRQLERYRSQAAKSATGRIELPPASPIPKPNFENGAPTLAPSATLVPSNGVAVAASAGSGNTSIPLN